MLYAANPLIKKGVKQTKQYIYQACLQTLFLLAELSML